ncbi:MAG: pantetheine-phosphate adenylyltransferase [Alphaproteobacteria bacterium]|jgi:pantetheine-phosphate adenylyltransferase|nr:pantetheine-phosphate adenylyltransferase [Alphaproteobacteria bacterium]
MKKAVYPGSFDPITLGHLDIIKRSLKLTDNLIVAVGVNDEKSCMFSMEQRVALIESSIKEVLSEDLVKRITVITTKGLLVDFLRDNDVSVIIRGIRIFSDFDYEFNLAGINSKLYPDSETIFLTTSENKQFISSRFVKEIAKYKGDISSFVSKSVKQAFADMNK